MTMAEWFVEFDHWRDVMPGDFAGGLRRGDVERLAALIEEE